MPADDACVEVVAATGAEADDKVDGAAAIEIGDALRGGGALASARPATSNAIGESRARNVKAIAMLFTPASIVL